MSDMELAAQLRSLWGARTDRLFTLARLTGLGAIVWTVTIQLHQRIAGERWAAPVLMATAVLGWIGWMATRWLKAPGWTVGGFLSLLAVSGGILVAYSAQAIWFVAVAVLGTAIAFDLGSAIALGALGMSALVAAVLALGAPSSGEIVTEGAFSAAAALAAGASRRQYLGRAHQAEQLLAERVRADSERDRAAALAERNRIGREVHDVLAHSLGALSVQLDAADALLEQGDDLPKVRRLVQQSRGLAVRGLEETRQAVHALRDEPVELAEQLTSLAAHEGIQLTVAGRARRLSPDAGLALYRAAQEALSNARKHAPGAPVTMSLDFNTSTTVLVVANGASTTGSTMSQLRSTGGGFGLRGMRERIELVGGEVQSEPSASGWTVHVAVPG
jgi:signal transduction histidine kinase